jgi:hypothetical protein
LVLDEVPADGLQGTMVVDGIAELPVAGGVTSVAEGWSTMAI